MSSMARRLKEVERAVGEIWSDYAIGITPGGHVCVTLRHGPKRRKVFTGSTPGDRKGLLNFKQDLRRNLETLKSEATL